MTDPRDLETIKKATISRFREIVADWRRNDAILKRVQEEQTLLNGLAQQCYSTAALFNFDLVVEMAAEDAKAAAPDFAISGEPVAVTAGTAPPPPPMQASSARTVRDVIIEEGARAYPKSVRASDVRKLLTDRGYKVHEKTAGMTLYRLSTKNIFRREKLDWFFIPEDQRPKVASAEESPGADTPGLFATTH